jgi:hypothetical protein
MSVGEAGHICTSHMRTSTFLRPNAMLISVEPSIHRKPWQGPHPFAQRNTNGNTSNDRAAAKPVQPSSNTKGSTDSQPNKHAHDRSMFLFANLVVCSFRTRLLLMSHNTALLRFSHDLAMHLLTRFKRGEMSNWPTSLVKSSQESSADLLRMLQTRPNTG